jgi:hypothetical protein
MSDDLAFNFLTQAAQRTQTCKNTISYTIKLPDVKENCCESRRGIRLSRMAFPQFAELWRLIGLLVRKDFRQATLVIWN